MPLKQGQALVAILKERFEKNMKRHSGIDWSNVEARLRADPEKIWSLNEMEKTGGEPDVVGHDRKSGEYIFFDCSPETPKGIPLDAPFDLPHRIKNVELRRGVAMVIAPAGSATARARPMKKPRALAPSVRVR